MRKTRLLTVAVCAAAIMGLGGNAALAGEVNGNGKNTPIGAAPDNDQHASSICSFSGQNPEQFLPEGSADFEPGRVQNWGHIPKEARDAIGKGPEQPGNSCNGHTGFFAGG